MRNVLWGVVAIALLAAPGVAAAADAVASADGETPGTHLDVKELKRGGDETVMLRFSVANDREQALDLNQLMKGEGTIDWHSVDGVYLLDNAGKKKYLVVRDSDQHCVCSRDIQDLPPKTAGSYWAKFPAPPDNVEKVGIVVPHFIPMDDVLLGK